MRPITHHDHDWIERRARVSALFREQPIASTAMLTALMTTLYRGSTDALGHAHRVATVACRIAGELGLSERETGDLERAAWLHDLGKFLSPETDPQDPLDVSTSRWARQVDMAVSLIEESPFLRPAAALVRASRECMDGSGYPRGLRGGEIPLGARVLHVADTFDALSSVCASLGVTQEAVPAELVRNAGSRFDPAVVAACLRTLESPLEAA